MYVLPQKENKKKRMKKGEHMWMTCKLRDGLKGTFTLG